MALYRIKNITEADYGCEERLDGPHALLRFENGGSVEVTESWITEKGIEEGKQVWISADGKVSKAIEVVAAVIKHGSRIFATQRGYGEFKDMWEFPGGKMEPGEAPESALVREDKGRTGY